MRTHEEHILRILREASEPLFPSEIAERLNRELGGSAYTRMEVVYGLQSLENVVAVLLDGRWRLKREGQ